MTEAVKQTPREALLDNTLLGFHCDIQAARKLVATTSGKEHARNRLVAAPEMEQNPEAAAAAA